MGGDTCEGDLRKAWSWQIGFGRDMICQEGLEYWEIKILFVRLIMWDFGFFLPSGLKTCRRDSSVAESSAVLWLQTHFQPFLATRNILRVCL